MKKAVLAIAAVLTVALTASPSFAQRGKAVDPAVAKAQAIEKATPLLTSAGVTCKVTDARSIGSFSRPEGSKKVNFDAYEVACDGGLGYILSATEKGGPVRADDCLVQPATDASGKPNALSCSLAGNANPAQALKPLLVAAGSNCDPSKVNLMGIAGGSKVYEFACANGPGQMLIGAKDAASKPVVVSCVSAAAQGRNCTLTTNEANLTAVRALATKFDKPCTVKDQRYVMTSTQGEYYEFACQDGAGYMALTKNGSEFVRAVPCVQASGIGGGCTLSDVKAAQTAEAGTYTKAAKAAGFNCEVSKYGVFPSSGGGKEIVELACGNRPDGAVAIFNGDGGGEVLNCARSVIEGYRCSYTGAETGFAAVTEQLKARGKSTCVVNGSRPLGVTPQDAYMEVTCADGNPGWVIRYPRGVNTPAEVLSCGQASGIGGGCTLPTNRKRS